MLKTENIRKSARTNSRNEMVLTFDKNRNRCTGSVADFFFFFFFLSAKKVAVGADFD